LRQYICLKFALFITHASDTGKSLRLEPQTDEFCYDRKSVDFGIPKLRLLWQGSRGAEAAERKWEEFLEEARPTLTRIARRAASHWGLNGTADAEDLVQDICLKLMQGREALGERIPSDEGRFEAYFRAFAANAAQDSLRKRFARKRAPTELVALREDLGGPETRACVGHSERTILLEQLENAVRLGERERAIFQLYFRQGFSAKEIAAIPAYCLSVKGVESLLHRITRQLRDAASANSGGKFATEEAEP
jgi:RNA polymerase sigma-70 factor, ECF subfamily